MGMNQRVNAPGVWARDCVNMRRVLLNGWSGEWGPRWSLGLIGDRRRMIDPSPSEVEFAERIASTNVDSLSSADLFVADPDMVSLMDMAAPSMPDQPLEVSDLLATDGFIWFSTLLPDRSNMEPLSDYAAMSWSLLPADHWLLTLLRAERDMTDVPEGEAVLLHTYSKVRDLPGGDATLPNGMPGLLPSSSTIWQVGTLIGSVFGNVPKVKEHAPGFYQRAIATFWTLARQPLTDQIDTVPVGAKQLRRKSAHAGVANPNAEVRVIALRRHASSSTSASGSGRKVGVRFVTRGYWRNQWMPSTQSHRHIYIAPHWRGPADAPLLGGEKVFLARGDR